MVKYYRAFSLLIASEIELTILPEICPEKCSPDVSIVRGDMSLFPVSEDNGPWYEADERSVSFNVEKVAWFRVENGEKVTVYSPDTVSDGLLQVYILGSCFGAVLQQRGVLLIHGSCVCREGHSFIITGESGNGKSTLAREFLDNGWKLVTDDVSAMRFSSDGRVYVIPSYPSQKLWQDAIGRYEIDYGLLKPLWKENRKEKFNADVSSCFADSEVVLKEVIWLRKGSDIYDGGCMIEKITDFSAVDVFMRNLYRPYFRSGTERRNFMFQQCVDLSGRVSTYSVLRDVHGDTAHELYLLIEKAVREDY